ncbi:hypothetical protein IQ290_16170 [Burkholderia sp. R-70199]|nr:hypothetical protein [Burkholderia sp. R-70199]
MGSTPGKYNESQPGMTLRDYFAAKALAAFIDPNQFKRFDLTVGVLKATCDEAATRAYQVADAMLRARGAV